MGLPIVLPKCRQPYGWSCRLESAARSTVMSQDTGMAMTLIGDRGFTGGRHTDGTVQSEELQAPMMRRG